MNTVPKRVLPWTKVGEPVVLAKKFGRALYLQKFRNPEGCEEEFALTSQKDWSVVLAITTTGNVLVVREYKQGRDAIGDELPAGTAGTTPEDETKERPEVVAARELLEETGYEASEMIKLGVMHMATRNSPTVGHCFLALGCRKVAEGKVDRNEVIEAREVSLTEWLRMVSSDEITEASAMTTTLRAIPHLLRRGVIDGTTLLRGFGR